MKELFKNYYSIPKIKLYTVIAILSSLLGAAADAVSIYLISKIFESFGTDKMMTYISLAIIVFLINIIAAIFESKFSRNIKLISFTELHNRLAKKAIESDYEVYTKYSEGQLQTLTSNVNSIANIGKLLISVVSSIMTFIATGIGIASIQIKMLLPMIIIYILLVDLCYQKCGNV